MEGPGVYLIREKLSFLEGKKILRVSGNTKENKSLIKNKIVKEVLSFGKRLIFNLGDYYLIIHFLMYGSYRLDEKIKDKKERLRLYFDDATLNFYNTSIKIKPKEEFLIDKTVDIMSDSFDVLKAKIEIKKHDKPICDIILNQNIFSGAGNIIKNEALFRSKIHPLSISKNIKDDYIDSLINNLLDFSRIFYLVRKNNEYLRNYLSIYGKKFCSACNSKIKLKYLGENKRKTYYCEKCQQIF